MRRPVDGLSGLKGVEAVADARVPGGRIQGSACPIQASNAAIGSGLLK